MVHGTNRNADHYFHDRDHGGVPRRRARRFGRDLAADRIGCRQLPATRSAPNEVSWSCTGDSWRSGGAAASHPDLTSFDFIDQVLKKLANKNVFPNLGAIVVAGHSAGGQFGRALPDGQPRPRHLGVPVTYVVANPSSYAWPDSTRPQPVDDWHAGECEGRVGAIRN